MRIEVPDLALVVLVGAAGSGKSTFARKHFLASEILAAEQVRSMVADHARDPEAWEEATRALLYLTERRLQRGLFTVVDASNVKARNRRPLLEIAKHHHVTPVAVVFRLPVDECQKNAACADPPISPWLVADECQQLEETVGGLAREGFGNYVFELQSNEEASEAWFERHPLRCDRRSERGPFDIIGDIHGCYDELRELVDRLGYRVTMLDGEPPDPVEHLIEPPEGRKLVFLGDLADRGPKTPDVLRFVIDAVECGAALAVPGNHDERLLKWLRGRKMELNHGLRESAQQLAPATAAFRREVEVFLEALVSHLVLDGGALVVAHAGMKQELQGRSSGAVRAFALYGESTGEVDQFGLPIRYPWAEQYQGRAMVVYGHTPMREPEWVNRTINVDTGCVFGGKLTALRYPELDLISVPAAKVYMPSPRPLA
ncbi:MAG: AAA family ATPase [Bryobacteraceae bacterium]